MLIDAHVHIFPLVHGRIAAGITQGVGYGCVAIGMEQIQVMPALNQETRHTADMLIASMDWAGVGKAVLLQGPFYGECNQYVYESACRYQDRLFASIYINPWQERAKDFAKRWIAYPNIKAVKLECSITTGLMGVYPEARLDDVKISWLWDEIEEHGLVLTLDLGAIGSRSYQTEAVYGISRTHPGMKIVIAHLGQPRPQLDDDRKLKRVWEKHIDLGLLPNVWFDTASLPNYFREEGYPYLSAKRYLCLAVDRIGASKIMWGSDIPGMLMCETYLNLTKLAILHTDFLPSEEREMLLSENALLVYGS